MVRGEIFEIPGIVDMHVHMREPGAEHKENFETGTHAALMGGVTTVFDMPNNPNEHYVASHATLRAKKARALSSRLSVDVGLYYGSRLTDNNLESFDKRVYADTFGLKLYVDKTTGNDSDLSVAEFKPTIKRHTDRGRELTRRTPLVIGHVEGEAVAEFIGYGDDIGARMHIAHVSSRKEIDAVIAAKKSGSSVTAEVSPHHLFMHDTAVGQLGWFACMKPSLKSQDDQDYLRWAVKEGWIDVIATDHAPHTKEEKLHAEAHNPSHDPHGEVTCFGVPGVEASLVLMMRAVNEGWMTMEQLVAMTSVNPMRIIGLKDNPGRVEIEFGDREFTEADVHTKSAWSPYVGEKVGGRIRSVFMNNVQVLAVDQDGTSYTDDIPRGRLITPALV